MRRRCIRCGVPDRLGLGLMINPTLNLCDWDRHPPRPTHRRPTCVDLFVAIIDLRDRDIAQGLVSLDAWETAGFLVPPVRYVTPKLIMLGAGRTWGGWSNHRPTSAVEMLLGSYNKTWWFPVEPHL